VGLAGRAHEIVAAGRTRTTVSLNAAHSARLEWDVAKRRDLELKGKSDPVPVLVLRS
jgi:hypothetical protein